MDSDEHLLRDRVLGFSRAFRANKIKIPIAIQSFAAAGKPRKSIAAKRNNDRNGCNDGKFGFFLVFVSNPHKKAATLFSYSIQFIDENIVVLPPNCWTRDTVWRRKPGGVTRETN